MNYNSSLRVSPAITNTLIFLFLATYTFASPLNINATLLVLLGLAASYFLIRGAILMHWSTGALTFLYSLILFFSLSNPVVHIDFKYHAALFLTFTFFTTIVRVERGSLNAIYYSGIFIAAAVFFCYLFVYFSGVTNPYREDDVPLYRAFRVAGPLLDIFLIIPFVYSAKELSNAPVPDWGIYISFPMALTACALSGSNQMIVLVTLFYAVAVLRFRMRMLLPALMGVLVVVFISRGQLTADHVGKINEIANPLQSQTILTRLADLNYAVNTLVQDKGQVIWGAGLGVKSEVPRISLDGKKIEYRDFLEIDNGFYYVAHRVGVLGLTFFIIVVFYIGLRYGGYRNRAMFMIYFVIVNALSIHFFTSILSALLASIMIAQPRGEIVTRRFTQKCSE